MAQVIGIDLGTTNSCIAWLRSRKAPSVIPNLEGHPVTPSVVSFTTAGEMLVGNAAQRQAVTNPQHTIFAVKRLVGRKYRSPEVSEMMKKIPFGLTEAANGDVLINVGAKHFTPQEVSSVILGYLKKCAEAYLGDKVEAAVITVPAHFDDHQRQATVDAAKIIDLEVLRMINEPTAASIAFGLDTQAEGNVAVFDMGGGTFDITLLEIHKGVFHVLATNGDTYLGGEDFDMRIVDWMIEEFWEENQIDLSVDKLALQRIKEAAERAKRDLSYSSETEIHLPFIMSGAAGSLHIRKKFTRTFLEELTSDLVEKTIPLLQQTLEECRLKASQVDEVLLVGGQTRMPLINRKIRDFFQKQPSARINPDEAVAIGAAVQASQLKGDAQDILLLDVTPLSLGIESELDGFEVIIPKNTTIPAIRTRPFTTVEDNQKRVRVHVLQGESTRASENRSLAMFELVGIRPAPAGFPQIDVTFAIDADGIVRVSAKDMLSGKEQRIETKTSSGLSRDEFERITQKQRQTQSGSET